jgi:hypothetical protein
MITTSLTFYGFSKSQASRSANSLACFQPLDPGVIDASIPTFFVGRDHDGFWLARDAKGVNGGIFLFKASALAFARRTSAPRGCAIILLSERCELDIANQGNPLACYLKPLLRLLTCGRDSGS